MRIETDFLGEKQIPESAFYGIHSVRAKENFPYYAPFSKVWYKALGNTKLACYLTYQKFCKAALTKYKPEELQISFFDEQIIEALKNSATEVAAGEHFEHFIVSALQGGAGTSINMNINEIITNRALQFCGFELGNYSKIHPIEHANIYQSTNDVVPSSLKLAAIQLLVELEESINQLRREIEKLENRHRDSLRLGYTQMQEAVPTSFGKLFSSYNEALSRDWWRVSKCFERIKVINLGGSAIGTSIAVPRYFVMEVVNQLRELTQLPITKSENLPDATSNLDTFVEVHAILKALAVNLEKMSSDMRLLSSDLCGSKEVTIPKKQLGSTIMPSKVNPVIVEYIISTSQKVYCNDMLISSLSAQGCLELNAYLPSIGNALLESIEMLIAACNTLRINLFSELQINSETAYEKLLRSPSITTALTPYIGYRNATDLANTMKMNNISIIEANERMNLISTEKMEKYLRTDFLLKSGFQLQDIVNL